MIRKNSLREDVADADKLREAVMIELTETEAPSNIAISYLKEELVRLNVFGNIAAGTPINMNVDTQQHFFLPREWFKSEDYFILKIVDIVSSFSQGFWQDNKIWIDNTVWIDHPNIQ